MTTYHIATVAWEQYVYSDHGRHHHVPRRALCGVSGYGNIPMHMRRSGNHKHATCEACILLYLVEKSEGEKT